MHNYGHRSKMVKTHTDTKLFIVIAITALLLGAILYLFYNPNVIFVKRFMPFYNSTLRKKPIRSLIAQIAASYGADVCWSIALPLAVQSIWNLDMRNCKWLICCVFFGIAYEVLQIFEMIPGTADPIDFIAYIFGTIIGIFIIIIIKRRALH